MLKTKDEIIQWLDKYKIEKYTVNDDLTVDVDGDVFLGFRNLSTIPFKFNKVNGSFECSYNNLKSLRCCPKYVGVIFDCTGNDLKSLRGCPKYVGCYFNCCDNPLKSIKELFDIEVIGDIYVPYNLESSKEYKLLRKVLKLDSSRYRRYRR